ncbi:hypothetical protein HDU87_005856 [Geranomyces variabilis]|uniref:Uncharacterized protein n=1 Tax=Geranomyces variabilis TaxID=109894 RepID=A0AAD5XQX3_9FUNG|nr:hypothetical protein HDU87_005856 [Geranomyces variabilis]
MLAAALLLLLTPMVSADAAGQGAPTDSTIDPGQSACSGSASSSNDAYSVGKHVAGVFITLAVSATGILTTIVISTNASLKSRRGVITALHLTKFFGIGVIAATAWIHLLPDAFANFTNPCLEGYWNVYGGGNYVGLFGLVAGFLVQGIEMFLVKHHHDVEPAKIHEEHKLPMSTSDTDVSIRSVQRPTTASDEPTAAPPPSMAANDDTALTLTAITGHGHSHHHGGNSLSPNSHPNSHPISTILLEAGIIFHSLIIGVTLGTTADDGFTSLLIAIGFHQFAEGAALGVLLSSLSRKTFALPKLYAAGLLYPLTTPIGIALGIALRDTYNANSQTAILVQGILDSLSAGILIYNAYCELISKEINQSGQFRGLSRGTKVASMLFLYAGAGVMAVIGLWA